MNLAFLMAAGSPDSPPAESPFADALERVQATFEVRDGWRLPVRIGQARAEELACSSTVGWADASHLTKLEVQVRGADTSRLAGLGGGLRLGAAVRHGDAWWCLVRPGLALVLCDPPVADATRAALEVDAALHVVDVTTQYAALRLRGPAVRELFARFCALDLRSDRIPADAFLPGSVARTPGFVLREDTDQFLVLVGAAVASYFWTVVSDAGHRLGGRAVGIDTLASLGRLSGTVTHA